MKQKTTLAALKQKIVLLLIVPAMAAWAHAANPALPMIPSAVFNITDYGAVGDGAKDNTTNIQNAINAASAAGGGTVEIPAGDFSSGPLVLCSSLNLHVDAGGSLQMLPLDTYPGGRTNAQTFISCNRIHDLEISGQGKIDGQGAAWWKAFLTRDRGRLVRPMMLNLTSVKRLFIHDITFLNPPYHHCGIRGDGGDITISNLTVSTPSPSPNTDGVNFVGTNSIIEDCHITDGDDDIAMGSTGPIYDLLITNCVFGRGHGVSIGSGITAGITNLTVINCTFNGTDNGIRIKCAGSSYPIKDLNYLNLQMNNVALPIVIYTYYDLIGTPRHITPAQAAGVGMSAVTDSTPRWSDITFSNVTINCPRGDIGGIIWGPTEMPVSNVTFIDVKDTAPRTFDLYNVRNVKIIDSEFHFAQGDDLTLCNADVTISNSVPNGQPITIGGVGPGNSLALYNADAAMNSPTLLDANPITLSGSTLSDATSLDLPASTALNLLLGPNSGGISVTGDVTLNNQINLLPGEGFADGNYTLFTYTGQLIARDTLHATTLGHRFALTHVPGQLQLKVSP
jgi:polygalacturonase